MHLRDSLTLPTGTSKPSESRKKHNNRRERLLIHPDLRTPLTSAYLLRKLKWFNPLMDSIDTFDQFNLRKIILEYPGQIDAGAKFAKSITPDKRKFSNLIICAMGGSALPANLLADYLKYNSKFNLPVEICSGYDLPCSAGKNSLIFAISYSGTTEETVECVKQAIKIKSSIVIFSSGGKLQELAQQNKLPQVKFKITIPRFESRFSTSYTFFAMHQVLTNAKLIDRISKLPKVSTRDLEVEGEDLAKRIASKTPVIYASEKYAAFAKSWKIKFNENTKTPAFWNYFPELNHNEMIGFTNPQCGYRIIFMAAKDDSDQNLRRMKITAKLFKEKGIEFEFVTIEGKSYLEKMMQALILGDWTSYYLACEYNQDPTPMEMVDELKKRMK
jgi:glucose/mannose-6-phosphate isomerase